ncbi:Dol-P-Man:Man(5)GlcNAc(2)-PP-Dol alpha-1,3-mannosyltransferase-like protein [Hapsidospora chrysogenum ATCC 11550]|uniref:Dol-P-Man:Man(5)GlcNAc(2)-PP-Dol alpha-1,3-mannosyltransferase-like protein n=1 Tax=Hapsidospora chrysogenum (strain ATCC 11550 / CBS 779.69 / DSM 880 / IAM 14645 / JCM 23072 / IMI 49137) TaxID=857340 RepID=A0A086SV44_HAPC1|nr:Dol-P-Man:Man(5)GlcNAc(2)-PP-Dol alpha-1,3-mannosyltransferase-like protein [Hapsidospora chrysogenum ATCC 11550]
MTSLSPSLKALINAPHARPGPLLISAPRLRAVLVSIAREASSHHLTPRPWIALSAAALITLNAPSGLPILHALASADQEKDRDAVSTTTAELIREVGLKCISFNGIPRTINALNFFRSSLPSHVTCSLRTTPTRDWDSSVTTRDLSARGRALWNSIYAPLDGRLIDKLSLAHPDLPIVILQSHYGALLADPPGRNREAGNSVGRLLTSVVAVAALRAQTGVGPQVVSHVLGLRKGVADGSCREDGDETAEAAGWLASDEGSEWILKSVDRIVEVVGGSSFATRGDSKL